MALPAGVSRASPSHILLDNQSSVLKKPLFKSSACGVSSRVAKVFETAGWVVFVILQSKMSGNLTKYG